MTTSRRTLCTGAAALAVTAAIPASVFSVDLTDEEARLLARVPEGKRRAFLLEGLRHMNPVIREAHAWMCTASESDLKWLAVISDRILALFDETGARHRGMNAKQAIARGYFSEEAFWSTVAAPVTVAEWQALQARDGLAD